MQCPGSFLNWPSLNLNELIMLPWLRGWLDYRSKLLDYTTYVLHERIFIACAWVKPNMLTKSIISINYSQVLLWCAVGRVWSCIKHCWNAILLKLLQKITMTEHIKLRRMIHFVICKLNNQIHDIIQLVLMQAFLWILQDRLNDQAYWTATEYNEANIIGWRSVFVFPR